MWEHITAAGAVFVFIALLIYAKARSYAKRKERIEEHLKTGDIDPCVETDTCHPTMEQVKSSKRLQIIGTSEPDPHWFKIGEEITFDSYSPTSPDEYGERFRGRNNEGTTWCVRTKDVVIIE